MCSLGPAGRANDVHFVPRIQGVSEEFHMRDQQARVCIIERPLLTVENELEWMWVSCWEEEVVVA